MRAKKNARLRGLRKKAKRLPLRTRRALKKVLNTLFAGHAMLCTGVL